MKLKALTAMLTTLGIFLLVQCKNRQIATTDHGCNSDLTWSNLSARCINPKASGLDMGHVRSDNKTSYLVMFDSLKSIELFLPGKPESLVFTPADQIWKNEATGYYLILNENDRYELFDNKSKTVYISN
ncbi:MAG: hypothetical protein JJ975_13665 [Bacteroidia bacterium]|nr:hypothetical protein [Bacteroidia bacterium]